MYRASLLLAFGAVVLIYASIDPASGLLPVCPFYRMTELFCPGCGSQRALYALLQGQVRTSFAWNPLFMVAIIFSITEAGLLLLRRCGKAVRPMSEFRNIPWFVLAAILIFWVLRNIPVMPFAILAPN